MNKPYNSINDWVAKRFGERIYKVSLESGLGCPNRDSSKNLSGCIFCNLGSYKPAASLKSKMTHLSITAQIDEGLAYTKHRHHAEHVIAYFQSGSNTHAPASKLLPIFDEAIAHPAVVGLAISTRPDCIYEEHLNMLETLSKKTILWMELGLQSAHDATLKKIKRGHSVAQFASAKRDLQKINVPVCAHIILGLPGETKEMMFETARFLNDIGIWGVKIHNLHVLKNTELEKLYNAKEVTIPSLETYAGWVVDFLEILNPEIVIHRVNSHSPKDLTIAPDWSVNKLAIFNEVEREMKKRNTKQGALFLNPVRPHPFIPV